MPATRAMDAAVMAQAVGKPVRLQYMRDEGTGWDPKGPASIHMAAPRSTPSGKVIAYQFDSKGFSRRRHRHQWQRSVATRSPGRLQAWR